MGRLGGIDDGDRIRVVAVTRAGQGRLLSSDMVGQEGDLLYILARKDALDSLEDRLGGDGSEGAHH